ncbi:MAG: LysR family transcriptional regulator [Alphaproteobacteria bacterium]|uniref:helix-turn-helix domain-containing protein n=1 Tax=Brevundimonas sp. TaxID=1871086 RepID=UPI00184DB704|nr:LysR family transcriptional regulator [Brevundimonas sp.]MBA3050503.1 LysR family transcriptional regulator [Brevundimonas sp.]MBU3970625.1 LysR family transcriptional regulator [Alphaproteobacteria bacterium]MBU4039133.1 LysR family transcriptional regulator [Alphaproteobacteria bacterium]MBU4135122.1 LysR family transcriptional regulator [Alphaproteobacteria bacterium]
MTEAEYPRWATETQVRYLEAVKEHGSTRKAAAALGVHKNAVWESIDRYNKEAARRGHAPGHFDSGVPAGYRMGKVTVQRRQADGTYTWERMSPDAEAEAERLEAIRAAMLEDLPRARPAPAPVYSDHDLLTVYPQGDPHAGLYSWKDETGQAFDLVEYERVTKAAIDRLVASAAPSAHALFIDLGDSLHADNNASRTKSGHHLDTHGRHAEVVRAVIRCKRHHIARLLERHTHVTVRINPGNHDSVTALMLAEMMALIYENEPRVTVATSPNPYWFHGFGSNLIGTTHGDGAKGANLPLLMAVDAPALWLASEHGSRVWFVGHVHHKDIKDYPGVTVEYCRTLAAPDIWSHASGYRSKRDMQAVTFHRTDGEVERHTCSMARMERLAA